MTESQTILEDYGDICSDYLFMKYCRFHVFSCSFRLAFVTWRKSYFLFNMYIIFDFLLTVLIELSSSPSSELCFSGCVEAKTQLERQGIILQRCMILVVDCNPLCKLLYVSEGVSISTNNDRYLYIYV